MLSRGFYISETDEPTAPAETSRMVALDQLRGVRIDTVNSETIRFFSFLHLSWLGVFII